MVKKNGYSVYYPPGIKGTIKRGIDMVASNPQAVAAVIGAIGANKKQKVSGPAYKTSGRSKSRLIQAQSTYHPYVRRYGKYNEHKGKKRIKVSRPLRQKIKKVVKSYFPSGFYHEIVYDRFTFNADQNSVRECPLSLNSDGIQGAFFTPTQIADAAAVLFNNKTPTLNKDFNDPNHFDSKNAKYEINNCFVVIKVKNNTQRLANVTFHTAQPRSMTSSTAFGLLDSFTTALTTNDPTVEGITGQNVLDISPQTLYASPGIDPSMRKNFKLGKEKVKLLPGQEYNYQFQGPRNTTLNMSRLWRNGLYRGLDTKLSRLMYISAYPDMLGSSGDPSTVHRVGSGDDPSLALLFEFNYYYSIKMPDTTGFVTNPNPNATQTLAMRRPAYAIKNWVEPIVAEETYDSVFEQNPAQVVPNPQ